MYGLIQELGINLNWIDEDILTQINDVYIDSRYPADVGLIPEGIPSLKKVIKFYELSEKIYENVLELLEGK